MPDNLLKEIWQRRSLVMLFAINEVKLRYRNSVLGFLWTFLEPLLMLSVLYFVFTNLIQNQVENYPLYLLLGLIIWYMFNRATSNGLTSLLDKSAIIQKIYFRREIVVISSCISSFIMMSFEFGAFTIFAVALQFVPPITIALLPLILIDLFILTLGVSLLLSVLNVYFRDIKFIWQVLLQAGFFLSPIIYTLEMFPENIRNILNLNPLVHIFNAVHDLVLYDSLPNINSVMYIIITTGIIFVVGYIVFRKKEKSIVEWF
jgi:lipopolysaccharide transport system permease protein